MNTESGAETASAAGQVPRLKPGVTISEFSDGSAPGSRFLVEVGEVCFVASAAMRDVLTALSEGPQTLEELAEVYERQTGQSVEPELLSELLASRIPASLFDHTPDPTSKPPFFFSMRLIPGRVLRPLTARMTWMFSRPFVFAVLCAFVVVEYFVFSRSLMVIHHQLQFGEVVAFYVFLTASTLFHELGHATACQRYDCPHGDIGFGMYFIFPAFYNDVTKAWRLPPLKRAVIDIGGVYFQCVLIVALAAHVMLTHSAMSLRLIWATHFMMLFTLNPIFKMDGYWLLTDLGGMTNLHGQVGLTLRRVFGRLTGRQADGSWLVTGRRLKVLYLYIALVFAYCAYMGTFLYQSIAYTANYYPWQASRTLIFVGGAYTHGDMTAAAYGVGHLLYISIWPILLSVMTFFFLRRLLRLLPLRQVVGRLFSFGVRGLGVEGEKAQR